MAHTEEKGSNTLVLWANLRTGTVGEWVAGCHVAMVARGVFLRTIGPYRTLTYTYSKTSSMATLLRGGARTRRAGAAKTQNERREIRPACCSQTLENRLTGRTHARPCVLWFLETGALHSQSPGEIHTQTTKCGTQRGDWTRLILCATAAYRSPGWWLRPNLPLRAPRSTHQP
jgi:hypothetical protein